MKLWSPVLGCAAISSLALLRPVLAAAISNQLGLDSPSVSGLNTSGLDDSIDRRFRIKERPSANKALNEISYKMIALLFMRDLALRDWKSSVPGALSPTPPQYPGVVISGGPEPVISGEQIPVPLLIWGLNLAMYISIRRGRFVETTFDLLWNDQKQGVLGFRHMYPRALESSQKSGQSNQSSNLSLAPNGFFVGYQPVHIEVRPFPDSQVLTPNNVWLLLYAATQQLAWPDKRTILSHTIEIRPRSTDVTVRFIADYGPDCPRRSPPFLQYSTPIEVLRQLAAWMLSDRGSFREVEFGIYVGGTYVGTGLVMRALRLEASHLPPNFNASTS